MEALKPSTLHNARCCHPQPYKVDIDFYGKGSRGSRTRNLVSVTHDPDCIENRAPPPTRGVCGERQELCRLIGCGRGSVEVMWRGEGL